MLDLKERLVVTPRARFVPADTAVTALLAPRPQAPANDPSIDHRVGPAAVWQPASRARIHAVEGAVLLGVMGYFAYGLAAAFGLL
jgi:hypothetical protein